MEQVIPITLIILMYTFQSLFSKMYTVNYPGDKTYAPKAFTIVSGIVVALTALCFAGFSFGSFQWITLLLGVINAIVLYCYNEFIIKGSSTGDYSILVVFNIGGGIVIPAIINPIFFGESFMITQLIAIAIIFVAVYLVSHKKDETTKGDTQKKNNKLHIIVCSLLALANGAYAIVLKAQEYLNANSENPDSTQSQLLLIYTFAGAAIISAISLVVKKRGEALSVFRQSKKSLIFLALAAVVAAIAPNILVISLETINSTLLYTFNNAGVMLFSALASAFIFRERLSKLNIVGCGIMTVALILMGGSSIIESFIVGLFT